jgi:hypothetical protein
VSRWSEYRPAPRAELIGQAHRGPVDHDAKQMLRTERNRCRHTVTWSPSREHWPRAVCRNTGSVMCPGEGTTTGTAPRPCAGVGEGLPAGLRRSCPGPIAQRHAIHRTTTWCVGMTCRAGAPTGRRPKSTRLRNRLAGVANRRAPPLLLSLPTTSRRAEADVSTQVEYERTFVPGCYGESSRGIAGCLMPNRAVALRRPRAGALVEEIAAARLPLA